MSNRELFLVISSSHTPGSDAGTSRGGGLLHPHAVTGDSETAAIRLVVQPLSESVLEQGGKTCGSGNVIFDSDSFETDVDFPLREPLPFSGKRSMFSTGRVTDMVCGHGVSCGACLLV